MQYRNQNSNLDFFLKIHNRGGIQDVKMKIDIEFNTILSLGNLRNWDWAQKKLSVYIRSVYFC